MKISSLALLSGCALLLTSCQTTVDVNSLTSQWGATNRINQSPKTYSSLSKTQKTAVRKGQVAKGMSKNAVRLAWGKPDSIQKNGRKEVWKYVRREQVDYDYEAGREGNIGRYFSSSDKYYDGHSTSHLKTVERLDRTVVFENGKAVAWTRTR